MNTAEHNQLHRYEIQFILQFAEALQSYGAPSYRVEAASSDMARIFGLKADFYSTPTSLFSSFKTPDPNLDETHLLRLEPGSTDLNRLSDIDGVAEMVVRGELNPQQGIVEIQKIRRRKSLYPKPISILSYALLSLNLCIFMRGGKQDIFASLILGGLVGLLSVSGRMIKLKDLAEGIAAFAVSLIAYFWYTQTPVINPNIVIISSLIVLLPGMQITQAIAELATNNLTAGSSRLMGGIMVLLKLTFGVFLARELFSKFSPLPLEFYNKPLASGWQYVALPLAAVGFTINFKAKLRDWYWILLAGVISLTTLHYSSLFIGKELGAFIAAFVIGTSANIFARMTKRPAMTFLMPGIILLVPGSVGYSSLNSLYNQDVLAGIHAAFAMFKIATAIVVGFFVGNVTINPRKSI
jgi:uncharacterized membrane protein YjjP (DUF1212 family)